MPKSKTPKFDILEFIHPEQSPDEIFLTNTTMAMFSSMPFETKRLGLLACDGEGNPLDKSDWYPVFVSKSEIEASKIPLKDIRKKYQA